MLGLIHKFLIYGPGAIATLIITAAGVWPSLQGFLEQVTRRLSQEGSKWTIGCVWQ